MKYYLNNDHPYGRRGDKLVVVDDVMLCFSDTLFPLCEVKDIGLFVKDGWVWVCRFEPGEHAVVVRDIDDNPVEEKIIQIKEVFPRSGFQYRDTENNVWTDMELEDVKSNIEVFIGGKKLEDVKIIEDSLVISLSDVENAYRNLDGCAIKKIHEEQERKAEILNKLKKLW